MTRYVLYIDLGQIYDASGELINSRRFTGRSCKVYIISSVLRLIIFYNIRRLQPGGSYYICSMTSDYIRVTLPRTLQNVYS